MVTEASNTSLLPFLIIYALFFAVYLYYASDLQVDLYYLIKAVLLGIGGGIALVVAGHFFIYLFPNLRLLFRELISIVGGLTVTGIVILSLLSGVGEEALFRGVIQVKFGLYTAAFVFAVAHLPSLALIEIDKFTKLILFVWTFAAGVFLGYMKEYTGGIVAPAIAHTINNLFWFVIAKFHKGDW